MRLFLAQLFALIVGESLAFYGFWSAWAPLAFIVLGVQVSAAALLWKPGERS